MKCVFVGGGVFVNEMNDSSVGETVLLLSGVLLMHELEERRLCWRHSS